MQKFLRIYDIVAMIGTMSSITTMESMVFITMIGSWRFISKQEANNEQNQWDDADVDDSCLENLPLMKMKVLGGLAFKVGSSPLRCYFHL